MPTHGAILVGEVAQHLATVHIACNFCPRHGKASVIHPMQEHGPDMPIPDLLRPLPRFPRRLAARIAEPAECTCRNRRISSLESDGVLLIPRSDEVHATAGEQIPRSLGHFPLCEQLSATVAETDTSDQSVMLRKSMDERQCPVATTRVRPSNGQ